MSAILLIALGAIIMICPVAYIGSLTLVFGYTLVIVSIVMILNFFSGKKSLMEYLKFSGALLLGLIACVLFIGSCILASIDIQPKTPNGIPLIAVAGIVFAIALAIYSVGKLTKKK